MRVRRRRKHNFILFWNMRKKTISYEINYFTNNITFHGCHYLFLFFILVHSCVLVLLLFSLFPSLDSWLLFAFHSCHFIFGARFSNSETFEIRIFYIVVYSHVGIEWFLYPTATVLIVSRAEYSLHKTLNSSSLEFPVQGKDGKETLR